MAVLGSPGDGQAIDVLATLAVVGVVGWILYRAFRRRIGGPKAGSEKAIVPALWLLAAIIVGILLAAR